MPLIACPDCERKVSDRAQVCPDCSCPVAEVVAERDAARVQAARLESREATEREVDCPRCEARGFYSHEDGSVSWCVACEHTGRLVLCKDKEGYFGVARYAIEKFTSGELMPETSGVVFEIGPRAPASHRYPRASERQPIDPDEIPW